MSKIISSIDSTNKQNYSIYRLVSFQNITNATDTKILWDSNVSTSGDAITYSSGDFTLKHGLYHFEWEIYFSADSNNTRETWLITSDTSTYRFGRYITQAPASGAAGFGSSAMVNITSATATASVYAWQNSGSTLTLSHDTSLPNMIEVQIYKL